MPQQEDRDETSDSRPDSLTGARAKDAGSPPVPSQSGKTPVERQRRTRRKGPERRNQIASVTLDLMARHGLSGATVYRIADEVGMEAPSLYFHFANRREMLLAAMDTLFDRVANWLAKSDELSGLRRLQEIGESHASFMASEFNGFVIPTFEFITAPRDSGLSEAIGRRQMETLDAITAVVEAGKADGSIRQDVDCRMAAYEVMMCAWAEDVSQLMGITEFLDQKISERVLRVFLRSIASSPDLVPDLEQDLVQRVV